MIPTFTTDAKLLSDALTLLLASAEVRGTEPILSFVLMDARDGKLHLSATDRDIAITITIDAVVNETESFCAPLKHLSELVRLMKGELAFEVGDQVAVSNDKARYRFPTLEVDRFPAIELADDVKLTIPGSLLASMLTAAMIAMETNPNGEDRWKAVEVEAKNEQLSITGICGPRMASATIRTGAEFYLLLPSKCAVALTAFAAKFDEVTLALSPNLLTVRSPTSTASFKLSANKWPDWRQVMAVEFTHSVELDTETLVPTLRRALLASEENKLRVSRVDFELGGETVNLFSKSPEKGEGSETLAIDCPSLNGNTLKVAFAANQLMEFFKIVKGPFVWQLDESHSVLRFTPKEPLAFEYQYVLGKLRI